MDDVNSLLLLFWTQLTYAVTSCSSCFQSRHDTSTPTRPKNSLSAAIKLAGRALLLSAGIVCKHVTMITNHGYVTRPTSANHNACNIV